MMGNIIYEECKEGFGDMTPREARAPRQKGRRERYIDELICDRRQLCKRWTKAAPEEKAGLKVLWTKLKQTLASLRRVDRLRRRRRKKEKERRDFFKYLFKHAHQLLDEKRSGTLEISKEDLEQYIKGQYSDTA